jgi:arylsulfatase A-like enzyme
VPQDSESLHTHYNRWQNRYKYRDQGIDQNLMRNMKAHYYACISFIDHQAGRILDALEATGQLENTMVILSSDHGEHLGDYNCFGKRTMHDSCARVPMLVSLPGRFEGGGRCDLPANLVDVMPTILAAAGCDTEGLAMDGVDLHALSQGDCEREAVYSQVGEKGTAIYFVVTDRWKYAYSAADQQEYLFDRVADPQETRNRAGLSTTGGILNMLRQQTIDFVVEGGESDAADGDAWKEYPKLEIPADPDTGLLVQDRPDYVLDLPGYTDAS